MKQSSGEVIQAPNVCTVAIDQYVCDKFPKVHAITIVKARFVYIRLYEEGGNRE